MKKVSILASIAFCIGILFSSCEKEQNLAAEIAGTYKGVNFSKTETSAIVIISEIDNNTVSIQYDSATKELAPVGSDVNVTKEGNVYKLSGATAIETTEGTVENNVLKLKILMNDIEIVNIQAEKE